MIQKNRVRTLILIGIFLILVISGLTFDKATASVDVIILHIVDEDSNNGLNGDWLINPPIYLNGSITNSSNDPVAFFKWQYSVNGEEWNDIHGWLNVSGISPNFFGNYLWLTPIDGQYYIRLAASDPPKTQTYYSESTPLKIKVDWHAPNIKEFQINGGSSYTDSINVSLTLDVPDNHSLEYRLRNDNEIWTNWNNFTINVTIPWTLRDEDGWRTVEVEVKDQVNFTTFASDTIIVDREDPFINTFEINDNELYTDSRNVTLTLNATDLIGTVEYRLRNDNEPWSYWNQTENLTIPWTLRDEDGWRTVEVEVRDQANHTTSMSDTIYLNQEPTIYVILTINSGALSTNSINVTLTLFDIDGNLTIMRFSNDNETFSEWEEFNSTKEWVLLGGSEGLKTVFVEVNNSEGVIGRNFDSIFLIVVNPIFRNVEINNGSKYTNNTIVTITISAENAVEMKFSNNGIVYSDWEPFSETRVWSLFENIVPLFQIDGNKTVFIQIKTSNEVLNVTFRRIFLDREAPTQVSISINDGTSFTDSRTVRLELSATDENNMEMCFSNDDENWSEWEPFAETKLWELAEGTGILTVYTQIRDLAGNTHKTSDYIEFRYIVKIYDVIYPQFHDHLLPLVIKVNATDNMINETNMKVTAFFGRNGGSFDYELELVYNTSTSLWQNTVDSLYYNYEDALVFYINGSNDFGYVVDYYGESLYAIIIVDQTIPEYTWISKVTSLGELGQDYYFSITMDDRNGSGVNMDDITLY
ncbi:MAG: hypothetical protein ACFFCQ_07020, partial [Promethearchaeota archaeon]